MKIVNGFGKLALGGLLAAGCLIIVPTVRGFITQPSEVTITAYDDEAAEIGPNTGNFKIWRTGGNLTVPLTVYFEIPTGSAQNGSDYETLPEWVTIPQDAPCTDVIVTPILDANCSEGSETVVLTLATNANYWVGWPNSATVTIADVPADGDSDGDGLLDCWELAQFGDLDETSGGNPDGDALTNLQEYLHGTNPNQSDTTTDSGNLIALQVYTPLK